MEKIQTVNSYDKITSNVDKINSPVIKKYIYKKQDFEKSFKNRIFIENIIK